MSAAPQPYSRRERRWVACVLIAVLLAHVASFCYFKSLDAQQPDGPRYPVMSGDSMYYARVADNLLRFGVFTDSPQDLAPTNANLPAYPFVLSVTKGLTGSFTPFLILQMSLVLLGVFFMHAIARRFVPWQYALAGATLYGLEPMAVLANSALLTDGLFSALLITLVYIAFVQEQLLGWRRAVAVGALLGMLALLRPTGELLMPVVFFFFVLQEWLRAPERRVRATLACGATVSVVIAAIIVPWMVRNNNHFERFEIFHSGSHVLLDYDVRPFLAWRALQSNRPTSVYYPARHLNDPVFTAVDAEIAAALVAMTPPNNNPENYVSALAVRYILHDPIRYAYFHLAHVPVYLYASGIAAYDQFARMELSPGGDLSESTMYKVILALNDLKHGTVNANVLWAGAILGEVAFWMLISVFAVIGLFIRRGSLTAWALAAIIAYFALVTGPVTVARYRIPAEPLLLILATIGAHAIVSRALLVIRHRRSNMPDAEIARFARLVRYLFSGGLVFLINLASYSALVESGMWYINATIISFFCGFIASFILQKFFAFRDQAGPGRGGQVGLYILLVVFNLIANTAIIAFFVGYIGAPAILGIVVSNVFIAAWNFFIYDRVLFIERELQVPSLPAVLSGSLAAVSTIIPCRNEEESIGAVLDAVPRGIGEVIVVDNNSTDQTASVAKTRGARVIYEKRPGYGAAVKAGMRVARGSVIAILDGDNQHPAGELPRMLHVLESEHLDFISGARFPLSDTWLRGAGNWGLTFATNLLFGLSLTDSQSGMVLFRRSLLERVMPENDGPASVQEMKIRAATTGRFTEVRIPCIPRAYGVSKLSPLRHGARLLGSLLLLRITGAGRR